MELLPSGQTKHKFAIKIPNTWRIKLSCACMCARSIHNTDKARKTQTITHRHTCKTDTRIHYIQAYTRTKTTDTKHTQSHTQHAQVVVFTTQIIHTHTIMYKTQHLH